jgi:hypothetical protein
MTTVPGTPATLAGMGATQLRKIAFAKQLYEDSILPSVFTALETSVKVVGNRMIPEKSGIFMKIKAESMGPAQSEILGMAKPLNDAPVYGTTASKLGSEEDRDLLWTQVFYNEIFKAVKQWKYGYNFNDTAYLNLNATNKKALNTFIGELRDDRIHQAILLRYGEELTADPLNLSQQFNPNWIMPNLAESSFPAWDKDEPTKTNGAADSDGYYSSRTYSGATSFAENIAVSLLAASGTGSTPKNLMDVEMLNFLSDYLPATLQMPPVMIDGIPTIPILIPTKVKTWMFNPENDRSLGKYLKEVNLYKSDSRSIIPGELGRVCENLLLIHDMRGMTLTVGGSLGAYTLKPGFRHPGNNDDRNLGAWSNTSGSTNYVFDLCVALGEYGLAEYLVDPLNMNLMEQTQFGQIEANGAYFGEGIMTPFWDKDAASRLDGASKTMIYRGSAIIPVGRTAGVTVR